MNQARSLAFSSLVKSEKAGKYANLELRAALGGSDLSPRDKALYTRLYFGVIEKKITLDYLLSRISSLPLNTLSVPVKCLLELGAYQILYLDRVPDRAAIFETVELAKKHCPHAEKYINGVLRRISREKETIFSYLDLPGKKGLALRYGYPRHLVSLWQESYGKEKCEEILRAQNTPAPLTLRVNTLKISVSDFCDRLAALSVPFHRNTLFSEAITLEKDIDPAAVCGFEEGLFFIQDAAAASAVHRLGARPGEKILDLCAAPGGKSFAAAMDMANRGKILALELHESRLDLIKKGAERLGITILRAQQNDSSRKMPDLEEKFDRVICDVPCSGYGTIARKPDIRHKDPADYSALSALQLAILEAGADALKPGGVLLYSTCTLNPAENEAVTDLFLSRHPDFTRRDEAQTIFPQGGEHDGFFCDLLEKKHG